MVKIENLSFSYGGNIIFHDLSFAINSGEIIGIWGTNGVGKTTLLELLAGIKQPGIDQQIVIKDDIRGCIGYVAQHPIDILLPWQNVLQNVVLSLKLNEKVLGIVQLEKFNIESKYYSNFIKDLSGGYQQRLAWACVVSDHNRLLLLDEPFSKQDFQNSNYLTSLLFEHVHGSDKATVIISHDPMRLIQCCHKILVIQKYNSMSSIQLEEINVNLTKEERNDIDSICNSPLYHKLILSQ